MLQFEISIILPAYQAASLLEQNLPRLKTYLDKLKLRYEIIIVDDGSSERDRSKAVAEDFGCSFYALKKNQGKGAAVRQGVEMAQGDYIFMTDADIPYELDCFERALWFLGAQNFHIVAGDRNLPASSYHSHVPVARTIVSSICGFIVGRFLATGWFDTQCGFKGFQAEVAKRLFGIGRIQRFAFDVEILHLALKANYDIKKIPVRLYANSKSSISLVTEGLRFFRDLFLIRYYEFRHCYPTKNLVISNANPSNWDVDKFRSVRKIYE